MMVSYITDEAAEGKCYMGPVKESDDAYAALEKCLKEDGMMLDFALLRDESGSWITDMVRFMRKYVPDSEAGDFELVKEWQLHRGDDVEKHQLVKYVANKAYDMVSYGHNVAEQDMMYGIDVVKDVAVDVIVLGGRRTRLSGVFYYNSKTGHFHLAGSKWLEKYTKPRVWQLAGVRFAPTAPGAALFTGLDDLKSTYEKVMKVTWKDDSNAYVVDSKEVA